jgi:DNA-binding FrmR family transcriptional regulator
MAHDDELAPPDAEAAAAGVADVLVPAADAPAGPGTDRHVGYRSDKDDVLRRLRRVEGQVRGLQRMVDEDTYCIDVLTQVAAATKALESVALLLLEDHLAHCVAHAVAEGGPVADEKIKEASAAIGRLVRS